jgi:tetratricopeptide (TPR) repeat protein
MRALPTIPIALIGVLIIFAPLQEGGTTHVATMVIRLLILFLLGAFLAIGISRGQLELPVLPLRHIMLVFVGLAALATLISPYAHPSRQWFLVLMSYVVLLYLLVSVVQKWEHLYILATVIVCVGVGEAIWAIVQEVRWQIPRPSGTFFNPNFLAGYLAVSWAMLLSSLVYRHRIPSMSSILTIRVKGQALWLIGVLGALATVLTAVLLTQSRAGVLVCVVSTLFVLTIRFGFKVAGGCAVFLVVAGLLIPTPTRERVVFEHNLNPVAYARWQMWEGAIQQMIENPLGIGLGLYQYTYPRYAFPVEGEIARYGKVAQTPHSDYLQMGVEMGPAAILVFILGLVIMARETIKLLQRRLLRRQRSLIAGLAGGGVALLAHAGLDSNLREPSIAILLVLCVGLILSASRLTTKDDRPVHVLPIRSRLIWGTTAAAILLLVGAEVLRLGVAWMYFESASQQATAGHTSLAIKGLREAVALDPGKALYHQGLGTIYAKMFESTGEGHAFQVAKAEFQEAIEINPLDGRLSAMMAQLYVSATNAPNASSATTNQRVALLRAARQAYDRAVSLTPFFAPYKYEQARLSWLLGDHVEAERRAKEVEMLEPNYLPARALLARLSLDAGRIEGATRQLQEIQERQERYKHWGKNSLEQIFLNVDAASLHTAIKERAPAA